MIENLIILEDLASSLKKTVFVVVFLLLFLLLLLFYLLIQFVIMRVSVPKIVLYNSMNTS